MEVPVLIEQANGNGFRVSIGQPLTLTAEGATRDEAIDHLRQALHARLRSGAEIASIELSATDHPLAPYAGMFKDNPLFDAWQKAIADRRQADDDRDKP